MSWGYVSVARVSSQELHIHFVEYGLLRGHIMIVIDSLFDEIIARILLRDGVQRLSVVRISMLDNLERLIVYVMDHTIIGSFKFVANFVKCST
jgi:hypothetical protein